MKYVFLFISLVLSLPLLAQVPDECLELPQRSDVCPHLIYKKASVDVPPMAVKKGEIVCICMADFIELRLPAEGVEARQQQQQILSRKASLVGLSDADLLNLIRK